MLSLQKLPCDPDFHHLDLLCRNLLPQRLDCALDPGRPLLCINLLYSAALLVDQALGLAVDGLVQPGSVDVLRSPDCSRLQLGRIDGLHAHYGRQLPWQPARHLV